MENEKFTTSNEDSVEIAAALAAVYAFCQSENSNAVIADTITPKSAWGEAARMESIKPGAGKIVANSQIKGNFFTWRNSYARRWTAMSLAIFAIGCGIANPALALERIDFVPPGKPVLKESPKELSANDEAVDEFANLKQPLCPIAPQMVLPNKSPSLAPNFKTAAQANQTQAPQVQPSSGLAQTAPIQASGLQAAPSNIQTQNLNQAEFVNTNNNSAKTIRIALSTSATTADIIVPDGAQIIDESNQNLLAELPPQSRWQLAIEASSSTASGKRLALSGKSGSTSFSRVLLSSGTRKYDDATYTRKFSASTKGGFTRPPQIIDADNAKFFLPVKAQAPVIASKQNDLRPVSYQSSPLPLNNTAQNMAPPPVLSGYLIKPSSPDAVITYAGKTYRGSILIKPRSGEQPAFLVINILDMEDYLLSVVPSEMPSNWNQEALKAQTIAARSYAYANLGKHQSEGYDLKASTEDQVYLGVQSESDSCNKAVAGTRGAVLKHKGKVVTAFFHSASGGSTEQSEHVYGSKLPYLKCVPDFDDQSPHFNWNRSIPVANIEENLKKQGRDLGGILGIFPLERSPSQRVTSALISGTLQSVIVSGEELRRILALPSTVFNLGVGADSYLVAGRGFGHGLGMSQWGAKFLSEQGYNASQILSYYYKDVTVDQF